MSNYIQSFNEFGLLNEDLLLEDLFSLHEQRIMPKYNSAEFKNIFSGYLNEAEEHTDDNTLNEAHAYYEIAMLSESRSSWGETDGDIHYIDAETHVILIKNSEAFIIEKNTFDTVQSIDESWLGDLWNKGKVKLKNIKDKVVSKAKEKIAQSKKFVAKAWDKISDGAKKAWEWLKSAVSASLEFIGDNLGTITLVLSILSAVFGIAGGITTAVGVGPILTAIGGTLMALNGGLHIYEGFHKIHEAGEVLEKVPIDPTSKVIAGLVKSGPDFFLGGLFTALGFYDISHGLTEALVNPAAGSIGMGVKATAEGAAETWIGQLGHIIEKVLGGFIKDFFTDPKLGVQIGKGVVGLSSVLLAKFFTDVCGWLYEFMLKSADAILKGINWLLDIPKKLTDAITKFSKSADGVLSNIIAKGLNALVKPMTDYLARVCEKYFKPLVKKAQAFIQKQILAKKILDAEMAASHGGHGKGADDKKHVTIPKTKGKALVKMGEVKIDKKDAKYLEEIKKGNKPKDKKVKESQIWEMNYLRSFDDLEFI
jgi:hypothetical protein